MSKRCVPHPFQIEEINFRTCFSAPSLRHFTVLMTGWVLTVGKRTVSNVIAVMDRHEVENFVTGARMLEQPERTILQESAEIKYGPLDI